jgi:preprotein translocase subunit SecE
MEQQSAGGRAPTGISKITSFGPNSIQFVKESWQELKKVHWPTRKETYQATLVVVVVVSVVAIFLGLVDFALSFVMQYILGTSP